MLDTVLKLSKFSLLICQVLLGFLAPDSYALAQENEASTPRVQVKLLSDFSNWQPGQEQNLALHFKIIPNWHTYWINPGDSGEPLKVKWESSIAGVQFSALKFPTPEPIPVGPLMNYGYSGEVTYLSSMTLPISADPDQELVIRGKLRWLVCEEECIPETAELSLTLPPAGTAGPKTSDAAALIARAKTQLPQSWPGGAIYWKNQGQKLLLEMDWKASSPPDLKDAHFFPRQAGWIAHAAPQGIHFSKNKIQLGLTPEPSQDQNIQQISGVILLGDQSYEIRAGQQSQGVNWAWFLALAFLGGLILNLMPCVFPVLSLKILHWVYQAQEKPGALRQQGWAYTAGVLVTFWALSLILLILRWTGRAVGWGFQFQSPIFNLVLAWLFFLMALALLGALPLSLPGSSKFLSQANKGGIRGAFLTGIVATIAATPCMAPLVGSTLGLALTQVSGFGVALLTAIALGLALPSLLLSYFPQLLKKLPKPGPWMQTLEQVLAFPLLATVIWLYWVLDQQTGPGLTLPFWGGILFIALGVWWLGRLKSTEGLSWGTFFKRLPPYALILGSMAWSIIQLPNPNQASSALSTPREGSLDWQKFSASTLEGLRSEGLPIFVNFTAAWCVTCQVNDRLVFRHPEVIKKFAEAGVVSLKADWTHPDPEISAALNEFGRQGVPLYVFYDKKGNYRLLPELLTPGLLIEAIPMENPDET